MVAALVLYQNNVLLPGYLVCMNCAKLPVATCSCSMNRPCVSVVSHVPLRGVLPLLVFQHFGSASFHLGQVNAAQRLSCTSQQLYATQGATQSMSHGFKRSDGYMGTAKV